MAEANEVLSCYGRLAALTVTLLVHARGGDWGALPALEQQCSELVERLREIEPLEDLDAGQRLHKHALLARIRGDHEDLVRIVGPQIEQLGGALLAIQREAVVSASVH